jgi:hypothetical protein
MLSTPVRRAVGAWSSEPAINGAAIAQALRRRLALYDAETCGSLQSYLSASRRSFWCFCSPGPRSRRSPTAPATAPKPDVIGQGAIGRGYSTATSQDLSGSQTRTIKDLAPGVGASVHF